MTMQNQDAAESMKHLTDAERDRLIEENAEKVIDLRPRFKKEEKDEGLHRP